VIRARARLAKAAAALAKWEAKQRPKVRNTTDPDSRLMPTKAGFVQGYNPQNVVTEDGVILATELTQDTGDARQAIPMMAAAEAAASLVTNVQSGLARAAGEACSCRPAADEDGGGIDTDEPNPSTRPACLVHPAGIGVMVMDAGYSSRENLTADGPDRLIADGKRSDIEKAAREADTADPVEPDQTGPEQAEPADPVQPVDAAEPDPIDPVERNARRLRTPEGIATYRRRGHIAETPHGHIKHNMGIRALTRRGLPRASAEWKFVCATYNLGQLLRVLTRTGRSLPMAA